MRSEIGRNDKEFRKCPITISQKNALAIAVIISHQNIQWRVIVEISNSYRDGDEREPVEYVTWFAKETFPYPRKIPVFSAPELATTTSIRLSLFKSSMANDRVREWLPVMSTVCGTKAWLTYPKSTPTVFLREMAITISKRESLLKSPAATDCGKEPVEYLVWFAKEPLPFPRRTLTLSLSELATTMSKWESLLKSPTATACGEEPVEYALGFVNEPSPFPRKTLTVFLKALPTSNAHPWFADPFLNRLTSLLPVTLSKKRNCMLMRWGKCELRSVLPHLWSPLTFSWFILSILRSIAIFSSSLPEWRTPNQSRCDTSSDLRNVFSYSLQTSDARRNDSLNPRL